MVPPQVAGPNKKSFVTTVTKYGISSVGTSSPYATRVYFRLADTREDTRLVKNKTRCNVWRGIDDCMGKTRKIYSTICLYDESEWTWKSNQEVDDQTRPMDFLG